MPTASNIRTFSCNWNYEAKTHIDTTKQNRSYQRGASKATTSRNSQVSVLLWENLTSFSKGLRQNYATCIKQLSPRYYQFDSNFSFIEGTVAEGAPIIPISAQLKYNIEVVCEYIEKKIPVPLRDFTSDPHLIIIRLANTLIQTTLIAITIFV